MGGRFLFKKLIFSVAAIFFMAAPMAVRAKLFHNSYVSFEMPDKWKCKSFGTDWVCHSSLSKQQKEAMIILTAKVAGAMDNFQTYISFLRQPREGLTKAKKPFQSKVMHTKKVFINNHPWVDGFHKASEIPYYFTRYLVTVCCENSPSKLAILVTYSAHQDHYTKYTSDFLRSINSLRVLDIRKAIAKMKSLGQADSMGDIGSYLEGIMEGDLDGEEGPAGGGLGMTAGQMGGLAAAAMSALGYWYMRKRRGRKKRSDRDGKKGRSSRRRSSSRHRKK